MLVTILLKNFVAKIEERISCNVVLNFRQDKIDIKYLLQKEGYTFRKIILISDLAKGYPPCMRVIVKETDVEELKLGSLFLVTCTGGSLGREGDHSVLIPDINISKVC